MLYIVDTADLDKIKHCKEFYPIAGVTTNPSIISKENNPDFLGIIGKIREVLGDKLMLHVQTTAVKAEDMVKEGEKLRDYVGEPFYLKVPMTAEGLKATRILHSEGIKVTQTTIFSQEQALMAATAGASFVAPYVNRLDNLGADGAMVVDEIAQLFAIHDVDCKILAASFKNVEQVHKVAMTGAEAITINPELFDQIIHHPLTNTAIDQFKNDWESVYGEIGRAHV